MQNFLRSSKINKPLKTVNRLKQEYKKREGGINLFSRTAI